MPWKTQGRGAMVMAVGAVAGFGAALPVMASAHTPYSVPYRPNGLTDLNNTTGSRCTSRSHDSSLFIRWGNDVQAGSSVSYNGYIAGPWGNVAHVVVTDDGKGGSIGRAVWGYNCRQIAGSSSWSVHSWGVAIDTNSVRNPQGQSSWNGYVDDSAYDYGTYLRDKYKNGSIGNFYWGGNFSTTPDPMHFQYVTGY